jgi:PAS domain S-box-containing protein
LTRLEAGDLEQPPLPADDDLRGLSMSSKTRTILLHYGGAVVFTALAVLLRWLLDPWMGNNYPFDTIFGAVAAAVWLGGYRPALLATVLGLLACEYLFVEPRGSIEIWYVGDAIALILYLLINCLIIGIGEAMRLAQRRTLEGRELLRVTLASIGDAVITTDVKGCIAYMNAVAESLTGWTWGEATGQPLEVVFHILNEKSRKGVENPALRAMKEGVIVGLANHTVLVSKTGEEGAIDDSGAPIRDDKGRVVGAVLVFRDVSEQRKAQASARLLASIVEASDDAIISKDVNGIITTWNRAAERIFGYTATEAVGQPIAILAPADRADEMPAILGRIRRGEKVDHFDTVRRAKDGRLIPISLTVSPVKDKEGEIVGASKTARDISDRKRAEEALREEKERLHATLTGIGDAVIVTDADSRITLMNPVAQTLTGWNEEATGRPLDEVFRIINENTSQPAENPVSRVFREGSVVGLANHTALLTKDGTELPIDDSAAPIRDEQGRILGVVLVFRDVSQRRRSERELQGLTERLQSSEQRLAAELEAIRRLHAVSTRLMAATNLSTALDDLLENAILTSGADFGNVQLYNSQIGALEIVAQRGFQQDFLDYFRTVRVEEGSACAQAMQSGHSIFIEDVELDPNFGAHRPVAAAAGFRAVLSLPLKNGNGTVIGCLSVHFGRPHRPSERDERLLDLHARHAADLIQRIHFEEALQDADRRKNEFLATLAHELRNPLAPLRNALQLMRLAGGQAETVEQARNMMERQLSQLVRLVDDLMDVSRISRGKIELRKEPVELAVVVNSAVETSRPLIEQMGHELNVTMPKQPIIVDADMTRLAQVFLNLLNNAAKYTERGGRIWLTVERQGSDVVVAVKDTGIGIDADHLPHIFEMFTQADRSLEKAQGGLGIGLTLVKRIVEMHGGRVEAKSDGQGRGSEFTVRLPVMVKASGPQPTERDGPMALKSSLRILIVDDNRDGADSLAMMLKMMGNDTRTAYDGQEAVQAAGEFRPDVVLLDIGLPKLNGYEACRRIREQAWGKSTILIAVTGWGQEEDRRRSHEAGFDHHMVKPVDTQALMKLLAGLNVARTNVGSTTP